MNIKYKYMVTIRIFDNFVFAVFIFFMGIFLGALFAFLLTGGFGITTGIYSDIFHVSKKSNDILALIVGLLMAGFVIFLGLKS